MADTQGDSIYTDARQSKLAHTDFIGSVHNHCDCEYDRHRQLPARFVHMIIMRWQRMSVVMVEAPTGYLCSWFARSTSRKKGFPNGSQ